MGVRRAGCLALVLAHMLVGFAAPAESATPRVAAAIVVDMNTGSILYKQEAETPRHPASLTKMMTLYVLFGYLRAGTIKPDTELVVTPHAASQAPTKLGLKPGSTITVTDAAKALVTQSANDAAATIAENLAGTEPNFARVMTDTGRRIGMTKTVFRNASGLPNEEQVTTARDMAILAAHLIHDYPEYYELFATRYFTYKGRKYRNHNKLLFGYKGTDGIKTGYTRASGFNLTASVHRGNKHLLAVVLGGKTGSQRDIATRALLDKYMPSASETKPTKGQLVASLVGAPPPKLPAIQKPAPKTASAEPPSPSAPAEGDTAESDSSDKRSAAERSRTARYAGTYHVQVGAFTSQAEAENRLGMVQQRAVDLLKGHQPFTASFVKNDTEWYRARFAGFSQDSAKSTCAALKKRSLECAIMLAE
jgi:D-alanyl-D-alanine carboxypeptidase